MYDVIAVSHDKSQVRIMDTNKTEENADAIVTFAVMRRGLDDEFYAYVKAGRYQEGDKFTGVE